MRPPIRIDAALSMSSLLLALVVSPAFAVPGAALIARPGPMNTAGSTMGENATVEALILPASAPSTKISQISASSFGHTCAVTSDGAGWCWGDNFSGELGDGTTTQRHIAVRVTKAGGQNLTGITAIAAGGRSSTCARTSDGAAWCWGDNSKGELGDGSTTERHRAVRVTKAGGGNLTGVTAISTNGWTVSSFGLINFSTCARTSEGAAWCWGANASGQLGDGSTTERHRAVRVTKAGGGNLTGVTAISSSGISTCARTSDGAAWCWGDNSSGQLGDGSTTERHRAVQVTKTGGRNLGGVIAVSAGGFFSCAVTSDGAAWCWGDNEFGKLSDGSTTERNRAVRVTKTGGGNLTGVTAIAAFSFSTEEVLDGQACARTRDGAAWCWGDNFSGELGDGTTTERHRAVRVTKTGGGNLTGVTAVSIGTEHACARTTNSAAWCWGGNFFGELGDGTTTQRNRAVPVTAL